MPAEAVQVDGIVHPFRSDRIHHRCDQGPSIWAMLEEAGFGPEIQNLSVQLNDRLVPRDYWKTVYPKEGTQLVVRAIPQGGDGGGDKVLRTVAQIAVVAAAASFAGPGAFGIQGLGFEGIARGVATAAFSAVGTMAVNALIPPPSPNRFRGDNGREGVLPQISGTSNQLNKYGVIPRVLGKHKMYPPLAAQPVTEVEGDDQYLRMLFCCGYGPLSITNIQIGETALSNFDGVTKEVREGTAGDADLTLYPDTIDQNNLSITLSTSTVTRTTEQNTEEISVDITFPQGLAQFNDDGSRDARTVNVDVEYRAAGSSDPWTSAGTISVTENFPNTFRRSLRWDVSNGQYDVRLSRQSSESGDTQVLDRVQWTALRSITDTHPIDSDENLALIALRIKATDQLNGVIEKLNCIVESKVPDYDESTNIWVTRATSNPASLYREVLQGDANPRPRSDDELDLTNLQNWHRFCADREFEYNAIIDHEDTVHEMLREIASTGRAAYSEVNGKYGVVMDRERNAPVQHFTPHNSRNFQSEKKFTRRPDAIRANFVNRNKDWEEDQQVVFDDGESAATATEYETMEWPGITDPEHVWKQTRFMMAQNRLRPENWTLETDIEHIICTRGDMVRVTHDVLLIGNGSGRVQSLVKDGSGNITGLKLTDTISMESGNNYSIQIRLNPSGNTLQKDVTTDTSATTEITFSTQIDASATRQPAAGDLFQFGIKGQETVEALVKRIEPRPNIGARLHLVEHATGVYDADSGTIPSYSSNITLPPNQQPPTIENIKSGEDIMFRDQDGSLVPGLSVILDVPVEPEGREIEAQYKRNDSGIWIDVPSRNIQQNKLHIAPVDVGVAYDVRVRAITDIGDATDWTTQTNHTVAGQSESPSAPTNLTANQGTGKTVRLEWTAPPQPDVNEYQVWRHTADSFADASKIAETSTPDFIDTSVSYGTKYYYWIRAVNTGENVSSDLGSVSITPAKISDTEADDSYGGSTPSQPSIGNSATYEADDGTIYAQQTVSVPALPFGATFQTLLFRRQGSSEWQIADQLENGSSADKDLDDLTPGVGYQVALRAYDKFSNPSSLSATQNFTSATKTTGPSAPSGVTATDRSGRKIEVGFDRNSEKDINHYKVYRHTANNFANASIINDDLRDALWTDTNFTTSDYGTTFYYWIKAVDNSGNESSESTAASATLTKLGAGDVDDTTNVSGTAASTVESKSRHDGFSAILDGSVEVFSRSTAGTGTFDTDNHGSIPNDSTEVLVLSSAGLNSGAGASGSAQIQVRKPGNTNYITVASVAVGESMQDNDNDSAWIPVDSNGQFDWKVTVSGTASASAQMHVGGYRN